MAYSVTVYIYIEGVLRTLLLHTDGGVDHARRQLAGQERSGGGVLLRDTQTLR